MTPDTGPSSYFRKEYTREMETWLSRRLRLLCAAYLVLGVVFLLFSGTFAGFFNTEYSATASAVFLLAHLLALAIITRFLLIRGWRDSARDEMLRSASRLIFVLGIITLGAWIGARLLDPEFGGNPIWSLFYWHFTACLFLPWKPSESMRPFVPLLIIWAGAMILLNLGGEGLTSAILTVALGTLVFLPGWLLADARLRWHSRQFYWRMIGRHFDFMRQELRRARSIHEGAFPEPFESDELEFQYTYVPTRELGGDFLHTAVGFNGAFTLTVLDVTGHGLAAALTVNRIYGELERIHAELPDASPADVIRLLNRYIYLTLSHHVVFATALCVQVDPYAGILRWSSAGHPPAFLRSRDGRVRRLGATTVMLGAVPADEFADGEDSFELKAGDMIVSYTDGVQEAQDRAGNQLGLEALEEMLKANSPPRNWPQYIASRVEKHSAGRAEDDVLVASIEYRQAATGRKANASTAEREQAGSSVG